MLLRWQQGRLVVITGPMFAGKSTELLRRVRRLQRAGIEVALLKPAIDTRSPTIRSHDGIELWALTIPTPQDRERIPLPPANVLRPLVADAKAVAIDEAQFLDVDLVSEVVRLLDEGRIVLAAGLDLDYAGQPFGVMPQLLAYADEVVKLTAVCVQCGADATRTQRVLPDGRPAPMGELVQIGGAESYEARCLGCWVPPWRAG